MVICNLVYSNIVDRNMIVGKAHATRVVMSLQGIYVVKG